MTAMKFRASLFCIALLCAPFRGAGESGPVKEGLWKTFEYDTPDTLPVVFSGWSRAENPVVQDYCIFMDVYHADGTATWAQRAEFRICSHGWEEAKNVFIPKKPVKKIKVFAFFRNRNKKEPKSGTAEFRDFALERREGTGEVVTAFCVTDRPFSNTLISEKTIFTGRKIETVSSVAEDASPAASTVPKGKTKVWTADSMRLVTPLTFPAKNAPCAIAVKLARRERESAQVLVSTAADVELDAVTLEISPLKRKDGTELGGGAEWRRQGYLPRESGARFHPESFPANERWFPDPLLPAAPMRVRRGSTQGAWLTFHAAEDANPGEYRGKVAVLDGGKEIASVPVSVTVRDLSLPETFGLETAFSLMDGFTRATYPEDFRKRKREAIDIMLDHRLNPDDISRCEPPEIEDLLHARSRGMNRFNILNIARPPKDPEARWVQAARLSTIKDPKFYEYYIGKVKPYVEKLREHGLDKMAYVYGFDERGVKFNEPIDAFWKKFREDVPGIPMMTTALNYRDLAWGKIKGPLPCDWLCPMTYVYDLELSEKMRSEGKKVWWYVCCSPRHPYANFASWEYPPIEGRLLGWMTHRYRSDGLLFWIVNKWSDAKTLEAGDTYFPEFKTKDVRGMPGDGVMTYPGKEGVWPSIKLAQCRDGVEDYEYLQIAATKAGLEKCDMITGTIVRSMTDFSRDPGELLKAREKIAELACGGK